MLPKNEEYEIHCADLGDPNCPWQSSGRSEEEVLRNVERHGREKHNLKSFDEIKDRVRKAIRRVAA